MMIERCTVWVMGRKKKVYWHGQACNRRCIQLVDASHYPNICNKTKTKLIFISPNPVTALHCLCIITLAVAVRAGRRQGKWFSSLNQLCTQAHLQFTTASKKPKHRELHKTSTVELQTVMVQNSDRNCPVQRNPRSWSVQQESVLAGSVWWDLGATYLTCLGWQVWKSPVQYHLSMRW